MCFFLYLQLMHFSIQSSPFVAIHNFSGSLTLYQQIKQNSLFFSWKDYVPEHRQDLFSNLSTMSILIQWLKNRKHYNMHHYLFQVCSTGSLWNTSRHYHIIYVVKRRVVAGNGIIIICDHNIGHFHYYSEWLLIRVITFNELIYRLEFLLYLLAFA